MLQMRGRFCRQPTFVYFKKPFRLVTADRPVKRAIMCGSLPPELLQLWKKLADSRVKVDLFHCHGCGEQLVTDQHLQLRMYKDCDLSHFQFVANFQQAIYAIRPAL